MQCLLEKICYWKHHARYEIARWREKTKINFQELLNIPDKLLVKDPFLCRYKIRIINNIYGRTREKVPYELINIKFDRLFLANAFLQPIHDIKLIDQLATKFDFGAVFSIIDFDVIDDENNILQIIGLFNNAQQIEYNLKINRSFLEKVIAHSKLCKACVQLSPRSINLISRIANCRQQDWNVKRLDECFEMAYTRDPTISKYVSHAAFGWDLFFLSQSGLNQRELDYNARVFINVTTVNPIAYIYIDWNKLLNKSDLLLQTHFKMLKNSINECFFTYSDETCSQFLRETAAHKREMHAALLNLHFRRNLRDLQKAQNIFFNFKKN